MKRATWVFILLFCLLSLRCAREVVIDLPEEPPKLVAVCHFTDGQNFRVKISASKSVNDAGTTQYFKQGVDATLSINGQFWDRLKPDTTVIDKITYWESNKFQKAHAGIEYSFTVRVAGYPSIQSSSKIPFPVRLNPIVLQSQNMVIKALGNGQSELQIPLELRMDQLPAEGHYFAFNLTNVTDVYEDNLTPPVLYSVEGRTNFLTDGRTFSLLHDIPEPVVLINENYWADDRRALYLIARIPFDPNTERPRRLYIEWRTLSEDFYRYHLSLSRQSSNLPFSDPDAVYNNIEGGYGNFSGYSVTVDTVAIPNF